MPIENNMYLSEEGYEKLKQELEDLKTAKRREISLRIEEAKKLGDLSENSEYMEAKEAHEFNERKIAELEELFRNAVLISKHRKKGVVQIGSTMSIKTGGKTMAFTIVGSEESDPSAGKISNLSPLGMAFLDKKVGDMVEVKTPGGMAKYEVLEIQ
ncbi:transcription elongation factor GreA [Candidatus Azambacteria bacterium RIFCSPLOWO2_01_FULL_46_25]|uniref:Transcription elongation factor GreA n=1 Tax=Candidatus Azambacteria bacterium RIFCSPLOWO2_01_FULL_46_25 TaxID=1797298 RepID=A0A1F5BVK5_9BACT|nr:MAG: transcription elongation factor GreA [Candidatus Azambacteria bacterium RIFCSPLOWO2_01_FULL_46_25]OGD37115.1 MAG: transcription elongation factor GreA [Candidatus Azambacteria bacterium RIFCSPHIGHO2_01_FULL_51_74]